MKKIMIAGASGFIGKYLSKSFLLKDYHVFGIGRSPSHPYAGEFDNFDWISADTTQEGDWQKIVQQADIIINLTGKSIFRYWSKAYKKDIYNSRILTTRNIVQAIGEGSGKKLLSISALGIYGNGGEILLNENSPHGDDFLAQVCKDWEKEALQAEDKDVQVAILRLGIVLGKGGGALSAMIPAFKMFAGGPLGSGEQWFPWVHIKDIEKAVGCIIENDVLKGPFNLVGASCVRQKQFAKTLGRVLNRPAIMPVPSFMVKLVMGELGKSLLQSQKVAPSRLSQFGCLFDFNNLEDALKDIFEK